MAVTYVLPTTWQFTSGGIKTGIGVVNLGVYATGGVAVDPTVFGLVTVYMVAFDGNQLGLSFSWDYTNKKVQVWIPGISFGAAGGAVLDDFPLTNTATTGVGASTARSIGLDNAAASPVYFGSMKELPAAVDLSALQFNVRMRMDGV